VKEELTEINGRGSPTSSFPNAVADFGFGAMASRLQPERGKPFKKEEAGLLRPPNEN
jgi:hypothetical protein